MSDDGTPVGYRTALRNPLGRSLWLASGVSVIGDYVGAGALMILAFERTGLVLGPAAIFAVAGVPGLLSGALAGSWLDRIPRGTALVGLQLIGAVVVLLPVLVGGTWPIFAAAGALGAIRAAMISVRSGAMAEAIPDEERGPLIALLGTTEQAGQVFGYLAGTAIVVAVGGRVALLLDAATFVAGAALLLLATFPAPVRREHRPGLTAGLRDIWSNPVLRMLAPLVAVTATIGALPEAFAAGVTADAPEWTPLVFAAAPAGQAITMIVMGRTRSLGRPSVQLIHLAWLALAFGIAALGQSPGWYAVTNLLIGSGVAWLIGPQLVFVRLAPSERMAQVTGTMVAMLVAAEGLGAPLFAALADATSVSTSYRVAGFVVLGAAVVGWLVKERTPAAQALDEEPTPVSDR